MLWRNFSLPSLWLQRKEGPSGHQVCWKQEKVWDGQSLYGLLQPQQQSRGSEMRPVDSIQGVCGQLAVWEGKTLTKLLLYVSCYILIRVTV